MSSGKISLLGSEKAKDTIYIDVDEEITGVIDRVNSSKSKIVALVLPKRATVMQSVVNMKLLKRTADDSGKNLVLITTEAAILPLAGIAGIHVASTPTSKPFVPDPPKSVSDEAEQVSEPLDIVDGNVQDDEQEDFDPDAAADVPVGTLASAEPEAILMPDDGDDNPADSTDDKPSSDDGAKPKKDKSLKVPSFNKFRIGIVIGIVAIILLATGWVFAFKVLPKAGIAITTDSSTINTDLSLTLDTNAKTVDEETNTLPAVAQSSSKTYTQEVTATGQVNNGQKAKGTVVFSATQCAPHLVAPSAISTGSSVTSNSHTYITQEKATYSLDSTVDNNCVLYKTAGIDIVALKAGTEYNVADGSKFSGAGVGVGSATGGTDDVVKVVAQADIDSAKSKIAALDTSDVKTSLEGELKTKGYTPVESTFLAGDQKLTTSANVGDKAESVKVTAVVPYTLLGIKQDDLKTLLMNSIKDKVDTDKQTISDYGVESAKFSQQNAGSATSASVLAKLKTVIGPKLNAENIRKQIVGMKSSEVQSLIKETPGVTEVKVAFSPFWVTSVPNDTGKITVIIDGNKK